jgi:hypothetical protein
MRNLSTFTAALTGTANLVVTVTCRDLAAGTVTAQAVKQIRHVLANYRNYRTPLEFVIITQIIIIRDIPGLGLSCAPGPDTGMPTMPISRRQW